MTNAVRTGCAACLVLAALGLAACGTVIDDGKAEDAVQASVEKEALEELARYILDRRL